MTENRIKMSRKMAVCIVLAVAAVLFLIVVLSGINRNASNGKVTCPEDAATYLGTLGWEVDLESVQVQQTVLPEYFDDTFTEYNKLQIQQGYDLNKQAGKEITVYIFQITNYPNTTEDVMVCLMTCQNRVIGGDIHSAQLDGFMHALQ